MNLSMEIPDFNSQNSRGTADFSVVSKLSFGASVDDNGTTPSVQRSLPPKANEQIPSSSDTYSANSANTSLRPGNGVDRSQSGVTRWLAAQLAEIWGRKSWKLSRTTSLCLQYYTNQELVVQSKPSRTNPTGSTMCIDDTV